jgi:hypothetical protein
VQKTVSDGRNPQITATYGIERNTRFYFSELLNENLPFSVGKRFFSLTRNLKDEILQIDIVPVGRLVFQQLEQLMFCRDRGCVIHRNGITESAGKQLFVEFVEIGADQTKDFEDRCNLMG